METMSKERFSFLRFEPLSDASERLLGGFSASLSATSVTEETGANNCNGGNCVAGCGSGQDINTVKNCGFNAWHCA